MKVLTVAFMVAGCALACSDSHNPPNSAAAPAAVASARVTAAEDGQNLFLANCAGCHGHNADGNTPAGRAWHIPDLHSPQAQSMSDQQLMQIIHAGRGKMPAWGGLFSQVDIEHLLAYLRSLRSRDKPGVR